MSSTSAIFSALPVLLFAFFGLVASAVLFIHIIRRRMLQSSEIDVEASAETTTIEVPLLVNAFKEDDTITTSLPTRPSQHFKAGLVVEHTFASTIPERDPMPIVKVVRYTPLKQSETGSWDLNTRIPNVTLSTVQSEKHVVIEQHDLEYAAQSCIVEEWVSSSPVESPDASLPAKDSRLASATPSPSEKTAASAVPTNTTPSAAIPALWRSSIQKSTSSTTTMAKTPRSGTKPRSSRVATIATQSSPDKSLSSSSSSKTATSPSRSRSTVTVSRKPRVMDIF
ncbi:hypothetical protein MPER_10885 [Moniliophthora perniciosa FA553]|nr:hypothetical protein MPER_10885 [Moniliophthora perniciosa FA553]